MINFSMNPDPNSWIELVDGKIAHDQYPDGSFQFRIEEFPDKRTAIPFDITIVLKSTLPAAMIALLQVVEAARAHIPYRKLNLLIQTLPDQRGDKPGKPGACISSHVILKLLSTIPADITIHDVHSEESFRRLAYSSHGKVRHVTSLGCFKQCPDIVVAEAPHVVAVDAGALPRAKEWAKAYNADMIVLDKRRDPDGRIVGHQLSDHPASLLTPLRRDSEVWVIDDLCDGGGTFLSVANLLRETFPEWKGPLRLYVTHGLFSKGRKILLEHYASVHSLFSYDDWRSEE